MKLIEFSRYEYLNLLRRQMGAEKLGSFAPVGTIQKLTPIELEQLISGGIDVSLDEVRVLDDGTLAYKDSRVLLYSRDVSLGSGGEDNIWRMPRFHFANCKHVRDTRQRDRRAQYVVAIKEDGYFAINRVNIWGRTEHDVLRLVVCEYCLDALSFDGFSHDMPEFERRKIAHSFSMARYFKRYPKCLVVTDSEREAEAETSNGYVRDHSEFGARMKRERGYKCDRCKIALAVPSLHKFLHVNYSDEARRNPKPKNVSVLCLRCHADLPKHEHIKSSLEYREFVRRFGHAYGDRGLPPSVSSPASSGPALLQRR